MHAKASSTLSNVDHSVDKRRYFFGERRELVYHYQQTRRGARDSVLLHLHQILHPMLVQDHLSPMELGM